MLRPAPFVFRPSVCLLVAALLVCGSCRHRSRSTTPEAQIAVSLNPHAEFTRNGEVRLTGRAPSGSTLRIRAVGLQFDHAVENGAFAVDVPLKPNRLNRLQIVPRFASGTEGLPISTQVVQDQEAPELWIDTPAAGAQLAFDRVNVCGRLSDRLLGSQGITVTVNGVPAVVEVGIGTNGTFLAKDVAFDSAQPRVEAVATDVLGNSRSVEIAFTHGDGALGRVSQNFGDCQSAGVNQLLPNPIGLQVLHSDGSPFPDKIVTFDVVRSDGGVALDASTFALRQQVRTNAAGFAQVFWRTGTDAGSGNNRVLARVADVGDITFFASTAPNQPTQINIGDGNNQRAETRGLAPLPLTVWVNDGCNGVPDVEVTFTVTDGGGRVGPAIEQMVGPTFVTRTSTTGHAAVRFELGATAGLNHVHATFSGNPGLAAVFQSVGLERDPTRTTTFEGTVFDNAMQPLGNATCLLEVDGTTLGPIMSDSNGRFVFDGITGTGTCLVRVEGATVNLRGGVGGTSVPPDSYPRLTYETQIVANARNSLSTPVLLPQLDATNSKVFDSSVDVELTVEGIEGLKMVIKAGSMRVPEISDPTQSWVPNATRPAIVSLNQVHTDDVPMPLPDGAAPAFTWTLQPAGALFDPPVEVTYPNMTGLAPGTTVYFLSFDHDVERFGIVATGRVCEDGSCSTTDQGSGIRKAGWGCSCPPYAPTGRCEDDCEEDPNQVALLEAFRGHVSASRSHALAAITWAAGIKGFAQGSLVSAVALRLQYVALLTECEAASPTCLAHALEFFTSAFPILAALEAGLGLANQQLVRARESHASARDRFFDAVGALNAYHPVCESSTNRPQLEIELQKLDLQTRLAGEEIDAAAPWIPLALAKVVSVRASFTDMEELVEGLISSQAVVEGLAAGSAGEIPAGQLVVAMQQAGSLLNELEAAHGELALQADSAARALQTLIEHQERVSRIADWSTTQVMVSGAASQVAAGGSYSIANVPATQVLTRASITYELPMGSLYGVSNYFTVANGQVVQIETMALSTSPPPLVSVLEPHFMGGSSQQVFTSPTSNTLQVQGRMSDGSFRPLQGGPEGTSYLTSNTAVAAVDGQGLVTAVGNGVAFVTARNEGVTAVARAVVSLGDPLTTVEGVLRHEDGAVGSNLQVVVSNLSNVQSDAFGAFHVEGIPSQLGAITVVATGFRDGRLVTARRTIDPVPGGVTDAGVLTLAVTEGLSLQIFKGAPGSGSATPFTVRSAGQPTLHTTESFVPSIDFPATTNGWFMHNGLDGVDDTTFFSQPLGDDITFVPGIGGVFSGRLIGSLLVPQAGNVTFNIPVNPSGDFVFSLDVGALPVFGWPSLGGTQTVQLEAGPVPVQLDFHSSWMFRLQLSASGAGFPGGILSPSAFGGGN